MNDNNTMNNSCQFSVLMSIYGKEVPSYFNRAMQSIWDDQILKPDEIVLVEDGPLTKKLYEEIGKWQKKLGEILRIVELKKNGGLAKALNEGIKHCSHHLIARMDTDDISVPDRFKKQIEYLKIRRDIHVLGGSIQEFSAEKKGTLALRSYPKNTIDAKKYMAKASPLAHPTVVFRKEIFLNGFCYSESLKTSQDIDLWYKIVKAGYNIANIQDVVCFFRVTRDFYSRRSRKKACDEFWIYWNGVLSLHGISWRLIYPVLRLSTRLMPGFLVRLAYSQHIRKWLNTKNRNGPHKCELLSI